jgi:hypothetical protein
MKLNFARIQKNGMNALWKIAVFSAFAVASVAQGDVTIRDVDVSAIADLHKPGQTMERISKQNYHVSEGLDVPLLNIRGTKESWLLKDARLEEWTSPFPIASLRASTVELADGAVIGGPSGNLLHFIKPKGEDAFRPIPRADELYWTDHVEGSGVVFAKRSKDGPLLVLEGEHLIPSPIPEKGRTKLGEFLPWYSEALGGYFTAWRADIWYHRLSDPGWQLVKEDNTRSRAPSWGFFQRGSHDVLSPDGSLLNVISKNRLGLTRYKVSNGYPTDELRSLAGQ